jgi:hypothetical protein
MTYACRNERVARDEISPLMLCDRFLTLAQEIDRAGFRVASEHLLDLAIRAVENPASLKN